MSVFEELIGKTIKEIQVSSNEMILHFITDSGEFTYATENDCCNTVWFCHVNGIELCLGSEVTEVIYKDGGAIESASDYDCLDNWFYTLKTSGGYLDIEVRNSHNGYYGGSVSLLDDTRSASDNKWIEGIKKDLKTITESF